MFSHSDPSLGQNTQLFLGNKISSQTSKVPLFALLSLILHVVALTKIYYYFTAHSSSMSNKYPKSYLLQIVFLFFTFKLNMTAH